MQVHRISSIPMIDKANNSLSTPFHPEGGSRNTAIVSNKTRLMARIDLKLNGLDLDLVVVNIIKFAVDDQMLGGICQVRVSYR